jgi:hypothetical protein
MNPDTTISGWLKRQHLEPGGVLHIRDPLGPR